MNYCKLRHMNKIFPLQLIIIMISFCGLSVGQLPFNAIEDVAAFKSELRNASQNTKTIACDFTQERHISMMTQPVVSQGKFWFKKPASVRWEYVAPYNSIIIFSRNKAFVQDDDGSSEYDAGSGQVFKNLGDIMFHFILGDLDAAEENYDVTYKENNDIFFVKLEPKIKTAMGPGAVDLFFDKNDYSLSKIIMYEEGADFTAISFFNKTLNGSIRNEVFRLK